MLDTCRLDLREFVYVDVLLERNDNWGIVIIGVSLCIILLQLVVLMSNPTKIEVWPKKEEEKNKNKLI